MLNFRFDLLQPEMVYETGQRRWRVSWPIADVLGSLDDNIISVNLFVDVKQTLKRDVSGKALCRKSKR
jgi:hypothetical protein